MPFTLAATAFCLEPQPHIIKVKDQPHGAAIASAGGKGNLHQTGPAYNGQSVFGGGHLAAPLGVIAEMGHAESLTGHSCLIRL